MITKFEKFKILEAVQSDNTVDGIEISSSTAVDTVKLIINEDNAGNILNLACAAGNVHIANYCKEYFAKINDDIYYYIDDALRIAVHDGNLNTVKFAINNGGDPYTTQGYCIRWSVKNNHIEIVKYILNCMKEKDVKKLKPTLDIMKGFSLCAAIENENLEITELLLKAGANPNIEHGKPLTEALKTSKPNEFYELFKKYDVIIMHSHLRNSIGEVKKNMLDYIVEQIESDTNLYFSTYKDMLKSEYVKEPYRSMFDYLDEIGIYSETNE